MRRASLWWSVLLTGLALYPYAAVLVLAGPGSERLALAGLLCTLLADLLLLCGAFVLALDALMSEHPLRAGMATAVAVVAIQDAPLVVLALLEREWAAYSVRLTYGHLVVVLIAVAVLARALRATSLPRGGALLRGLVLGVVALTCSLVLRAVDPTPYVELDEPGGVLLLVTIALSLGAVCRQLVDSELPRWAVHRINAGVLAIFAARAWSTALEAEAPLPVAVAGVMVFSVLLVTTVTDLLRNTLRAAADRAVHYAERAAEAEATVQHDREVAHEVRAATAGIVAGAHLLADSRMPDGPRRQALERMVDAEAARMWRRLTPATDALRVVRLDEVVEPLVVAQRALGHQVAWTSHGHSVIARPDDLAESIHVLLSNAARHASGRATAITSRPVGESVEIWVTDDGPGMDPAVKEHLFTWGARRAGSPGEGIGLQRAHRLVLEQGGHLDWHDGSDAPEWPGEGGGPWPTHARRLGSAFVITLPGWGEDAMGGSAGMAG